MKKFFKRLWEWLKHPHGWGLIIIFLLSAGAIAGSIVFTVADPSNVLAYGLYAIAAVALAYDVYIIVKVAPTFKQSYYNFMDRHEFTGKLRREYDFRTLTFAVISLAISTANAILNGVIGAIYLSVWYGALTAYYVLLACMRGGTLVHHRRQKAVLETKSPKQLKISDLRSYSVNGVLLMLLPVALSAVIAETVAHDRAFVRAGLMIYVSAAYTFYKLTMSIINYFKARRFDDYSVRSIRNVNLADAMVSVLALQTAMFHEFSAEQSFGFANALTGACACALTFALGLFMVISGRLKINKEAKEEVQNGREV